MPVRFPSESGPPAETAHGRRCLRTATKPGVGFSALGIPFLRREIPVPVMTSQAWLRRFNSALASRSLQTATRVANFDSEVPALNRRELGANPRRPTISASVVKLQSCFDSNEEFAGGSPAGCTNSCRVSPTTRGAPLRTERLGVELPHAAPLRPRSPTQRRRA